MIIGILTSRKYIASEYRQTRRDDVGGRWLLDLCVGGLGWGRAQPVPDANLLVVLEKRPLRDGMSCLKLLRLHPSVDRADDGHDS